MSVSMATSALKEIHDAFLADQPEGAEHDPESCTLCAMESTAEVPVVEPAGGTMGDKTYSEEEVRAATKLAVDEALKPHMSRIEELEAAAAASESEAALAELRDQFETEKSELQAKVDELTLTAETEKKRADDITAWLEGERTAADEKAAIEARREERLNTAKAAAEFPEKFVKYLEEQADRLAAMSDEEFTARVAEWAALSGGKAEGGGDTLPNESALLASREVRGEGGGGNKKSAVKELFASMREGVDPRSL